jgi:MFS family permease
MLFALASLVCALAPSLPVLLAARASQGIGAALLLPNSLALLNGAYSDKKRGQAVGIWAAAGAASAAIAPLIGGWLIHVAGWPAIFYINLPLALAAIGIAWNHVGESHDAGAGRTDYGGAFLATGGLGGLTYALTDWSAARHFSGAIGAGMGLGIIMLCGFLYVEFRRGDNAMMPLLLFRNRCFSGLNLLTFLLYGAFGAAMLLIPYVLISQGGYSPVQAGLAMLPLPVLMTSLSPAMGKLATRSGPIFPLAAGPFVVAVGMIASRLVLEKSGYWTGPFPMILVMAVGMTIAVAPLTSSVLGSVEERHVAMASGFNSAVARTGGLIATALLGSVLSSKGPELYTEFHRAMAIAAAAAGLASIVALTMLGGVRMKKT